MRAPTAAPAILAQPLTLVVALIGLVGVPVQFVAMYPLARDIVLDQLVHREL